MKKIKENEENREIIPIMFCFDKNYVIPAAVAFYSLLENANSKMFYKLYVLHSDISLEQQNKLQETIKEYHNICTLEFMDMNNKFNDIWENMKSKVHFSKEVLYKLLVGSIFPQYDKIIVSDVDVVFQGDISKSFEVIQPDDEEYIAGVKPIGVLKQFNSVYENKFSESDINKLNMICGGYLIFNLKRIRDEEIEKKFIKCLNDNVKNIIYAEQDILNLCCYNKMKFLPLNYIVCTYMWYLYEPKTLMDNDGVYTKKQILDAMKNPIQLHYASTEKPWKNVDTEKSEIWFEYIVKTTFLKEYLQLLPKMIVIKNEIKKDHKNNIIRKAKRIIKKTLRRFYE